MTKKPSEKNKAWEKDRRDRLNKTFDELAKLLPKFDPSVVWSKIEIIQKAIAFIADLHKRLEDYLAAKDPELLKEYQEFVECLRFYQDRNAQLTELLKKAKVTLPPPPTPVELPQLLLNKPELQPKQENVPVGEVQKPKRQRNRTKKAKPDEIKDKTESPTKITSETAENNCIKPEAVTKPTAIITAFGRDNSSDAPKLPTLQLPPPVPAKPLLLRVRKTRKHHQRLKLIKRPTLRKCYPHPSRMIKWSFDSILNRKSLLKQRRLEARKRKQIRSEKASKRLKISFNPEPLREQSVSPTAAFLLSFPVVTSSMLGGKNVENADSSVNLENLNNFFTTEEYSKFCDQNTVASGKIMPPLTLESEEKILPTEKPMTAFTVSAITRPCEPKKPLSVNESRLNGMPLGTGFENCMNFGNGNPMIGSTSMCAASNNQQITCKPLSQLPSSLPVTGFSPPAIVPSAKLPLKQEQIQTTSTRSSNSSEKFFPRYNHSTANSVKNTLEPLPKAIEPTKSNNLHKSSTGRTNLPLKSNCSVRSEPHRGKPFSNPITYSNASKVSSSTSSSSLSTLPNLNSKIPHATKSNKTSYVSPTKSFFYDLPIQTRNTTSSVTSDPLISATGAIKSNNSVKTEFPWMPPNTSISNACNQNTLFTPFDLVTIACESLTSTSCTFSLATTKSLEPSVVDAGSKARNQINLFLPYEETQCTQSFSIPQTKLPENQMSRETSWKSLDKPKDSGNDQIFYDCEQSKPQQKSHVNWMTSPITTDYNQTTNTTPVLPPMDFGNQFTGSSTNFDLSFGCRKDSYDDDNQFINWSPTKPLSTDFSTAYNFENFGSNEAPPNKTVKQIFSVSQLVDQTPSQDMTSTIKKALPKNSAEKPTASKQTFSNIYSAESLIAKKDSRFFNQTESVPSTQTDYHNSNSYYFNYPNTQLCSETDYLGAGTYSTSQQTLKTNPVHPSSTVGASSSFDFSHTISSNNNDPYDPTYFPSSNYNQSWNHGPNHAQNNKATSTGSLNVFNQFGTLQETSSCQQNSNVSGNLPNFNLSSICPEIDGKGGQNVW